MIALVGVIMACVGGVQTATAGQGDAAAVPLAASAQGSYPPYGWSTPYAGNPRYEQYAPRELTDQRQLNEPIGEAKAEWIARGLGLDWKKTFTEDQFIKFVTGQGQPDIDPLSKDCPKLVDESVRILTNTTGNPLHSMVNGQEIESVLGSYGLMVSKDGMLQSPANKYAATRRVNKCLIPIFGYLDRWARKNHAQESIDMLRRSAYASEFIYGHQSQTQDGEDPAYLVLNLKPPSRKAVVGMSIPPALWNVNFCLIYTLKPKLAANMPARWAPIPATVADAIANSSKGRVPFSDYASYFPEGTWYYR